MLQLYTHPTEDAHDMIFILAVPCRTLWNGLKERLTLIKIPQKPSPVYKLSPYAPVKFLAYCLRQDLCGTHTKGQKVKSSATSMRKESKRRNEAESLSGTRIQQVNNHADIVIRNIEEVGTLREKESQQAVRVFIQTTLPGRMGVSKIDGCLKILFDLTKCREFCTIIQCD